PVLSPISRGSLRAWDALWARFALRTRLTLRANRAALSWGPLRPLGAPVTVRALAAGGTLWPDRARSPLVTRRTRRPAISARAWRALRAGRSFLNRDAIHGHRAGW